MDRYVFSDPNFMKKDTEKNFTKMNNSDYLYIVRLSVTVIFLVFIESI